MAYAAARRRSSRRGTKKRVRKNPMRVYSSKGKRIHGAAAKAAMKAGTARVKTVGGRRTTIKSKAPRTRKSIARLKARRYGKKKTTRRTTTTRKKKKAVATRRKAAKKKKKGKKRLPKYGARAPRRMARAKTQKRAKRRKGRKRAAPYKARTVSVKLRKGRRMSPWRRRKLTSGGYLSRAGQVNPKRRKKRKRNPSVKSIWKKVTSAGFWVDQIAIGGSQVAVGALGASTLPQVFENFLAGPTSGMVRNSGYPGVVLSGVSTVISGALAMYVENAVGKSGFTGRLTRDLSKRVVLGGALITALRLLGEVAPTIASYLPSFSSPARSFGRGGTVSGLSDWMQLRGMGQGGMGGMADMGDGGMSGVTSPEALIAGESFARSVSQFDGMGNAMGDFRIPMQDIRGPGSGFLGAMGQDPLLAPGMHYPGQYGAGVGDWMETTGGGHGQGGGALAMTSFDPASETF